MSTEENKAEEAGLDDGVTVPRQPGMITEA